MNRPPPRPTLPDSPFPATPPSLSTLASLTPAYRADPSVMEEELLDQQVPTPRPSEPLSIQPERQPDVAVSGSVVAGAILVEGAEALPASAFAPVIASYAGRPLKIGRASCRERGCQYV